MLVYYRLSKTNLFKEILYMRVQIELNDDLERTLGKKANKRKIPIAEIVEEILQKWQDEEDDKEYEKSIPNYKKK